MKLLKQCTILAAYDNDEQVFATIIADTDELLGRFLSAMNF